MPLNGVTVFAMYVAFLAMKL